MSATFVRFVICTESKLVPRADGNGRILAMEVLKNVPALGNLIRTEIGSRSIQQWRLNPKRV